MPWPKGRPRPQSEETKQRLKEYWGDEERSREQRAIVAEIGRRPKSEESNQKRRRVMLKKFQDDGYRQRVLDSQPRGPSHHWYKDGTGYGPYPPEFNAVLKRAIRERDNHTCQKCGRLEAEEMVEFGKALHVHHIDGNKHNCEKANLITLCLRCNMDERRSKCQRKTS